ncbi:hypothetical protein ACFWIB_38140 [Streptomyces sp. NPDC127051]|uniref:hypothetical protein n=1 Tax=Streptomyces sp. NPDC127051 TaxID=3347119 RepID=UPI00364D0911
MWRTRWMARVAERGEAPHPPVLIVFNHIAARDPNRTVPRLQELTRPLWAGEPADGFSSYDRKTPIIATGLRNLREHGPNGSVFLRFGRTHMQPLRDAIGNPRRDAVLARRAERMKAQQSEYQEQLRRAAEQKRAEREATRPACAGCGTKFDNDRWENTELSPTPGNRWHPTSCEPCEAKTVAAADQAERDRLVQEVAATAERPAAGAPASALGKPPEALCKPPAESVGKP